MAGMGMVVPGAAATDLGLGGALGQQVTAETDEERKKRMLQLQQRQMLGPAGSLAASTLFGGNTSAGA